MNHIEALLRILMSFDSRLLMTHNEYITELSVIVPFFLSKREFVSCDYKGECNLEFKKLNISSDIKITDNPSSEEIESNTIAFHRIKGMITSDSRWRFSTKRFQKDIIAAEENPNISGHFCYISSGGGEAWYLDQLAETMRECKKPLYAHIEKVCGSAAYYIASQADHISASTPYDLVGCIGTMISIMDIQPMLERWGIKFIEEYAGKSDLKNKKYNDLMHGKPEQFITEELDPICQQFISDVKQKRSIIASLPDDHPVLRGETFYSGKSIENGLIDVVEPFESALESAYAAATSWNNENNNRRKALRYI